MKVVSVEEAVDMIPDGASVMVGGFMGVGAPERLLDELVRQRKTNLAIIANDAGVPGKGIGKLVDARTGSRMTASHIGLNPDRPAQVTGAGDHRRSGAAGHAGRANSRRGLWPRRHTDADRRRHHCRGRESSKSD